jgi:hypothetical protein
MRGFLRKNRIPLWARLRHAFRFLEGHVSWATWSIMLSVIGLLPGILAGRQFSETIVYYNAPRISSVIFQLSYVALFLLILVSLLLLPKRRTNIPLWKKSLFVLQWFFLPITFILLSTIPALEAQTRLMLGRYMGFYITDKRRNKE